jgi:chromosome segregation ATPase
MWKYLVAVLLGVILILGGVLAYRDYNYRKQLDDVTNQLAEKMGQVQETETAVSKMAVEAEDIKTKNKELQRIIRKRDQDILALAELNLQLKNHEIKIENATETVIDASGNVITDPTAIPEELKNLRLKVNFEKEEDTIEWKGSR